MVRKNLPPEAIALKNFLRSSGPLAIAYSGGLDSRFLCLAALRESVDVLAIHAVGPHIAPRENEYALEWAAKNSLPCMEINVNPLDETDVANNGRNRCYACKTALFSTLKSKLAGIGKENRLICDGGNADDLKEYRPGLTAVKEAGVISPLARAGMGKALIRECAAGIGMDNPLQKARPCLLTRLAYGIAPARETLLRIACAENDIEEFLEEKGLGERDFRLRLLPRPELHMDMECGNLKAPLGEILKKYGFFPAAIRQMSPLSGFFDKTGPNQQ